MRIAIVIVIPIAKPASSHFHPLRLHGGLSTVVLSTIKVSDCRRVSRYTVLQYSRSTSFSKTRTVSPLVSILTVSHRSTITLSRWVT